MMSKMTRLFTALQILAALAVIGAVKIWAPVCDKMLELANGNMVHMKCYYAGQAAVAVGVILLALAVAAILQKKNRKAFQIVTAVGGVVLFLLFTSLIGVCASKEMVCQTTALWGKGAAIVTVVSAVINLLSGKEGQIPD